MEDLEWDLAEISIQVEWKTQKGMFYGAQNLVMKDLLHVWNPGVSFP